MASVRWLFVCAFVVPTEMASISVLDTAVGHNCGTQHIYPKSCKSVHVIKGTKGIGQINQVIRKLNP